MRSTKVLPLLTAGAAFIAMGSVANAIDIRLEPFVTGVNAPLAMVQPPGDERMFVIEHALFANAGGWIVALSRWLPVFSEVIACVAGLARMAFTTFFVALLCGSVPLGFVFAAIGHAGQDHPVVTLAISALLPIVFWLLLRPLRRSGVP